jgi:hypothetical protein
MPKSKHRRKPGEKAVRHPGRGKETALKDRRPEQVQSQLQASRPEADASRLPLFHLGDPHRG